MIETTSNGTRVVDFCKAVQRQRESGMFQKYRKVRVLTDRQQEDLQKLRVQLMRLTSDINKILNKG